MRSSTSGTGRAGSTPAGTTHTRKPLVVRQTRASAARATASREQRFSTTDDTTELNRWRMAPESELLVEDYDISSPGARRTSATLSAPPPPPPQQQQQQQQQRLSANGNVHRRGGAGGRGRALVGERRAPTTTAASAIAVSSVIQSRPAAVARALQTNPNTTRTERGRAIQQDLDDLADDYFGEAYSQPPRTSGASAFPARSSGGEKDETPEADSTDEIVAVDRAIPRSWRVGPTDPQGRLFDSSDQNLLCMDVLLSSSAGRARPTGRASASGGCASVAVVGSADHGLRVFDLDSGKERKNLYTKSYGHTEWVTACRFLSDGRVLSGGMDSKLCLWDSVLRGGPARCQDLLAHTGSISQIEVSRTHGTAISASYDRTLRIWSLGGVGVGAEMGCLAGHKGPVTQFHWQDTTVLSGDRQGTAKVWDVPTATCLLTCATKRGQIGALGQFDLSGPHTLSLIGDQGGVLTVLDARQGKKPVHQSEPHPGGVLSGIQVTARCVVTCGADKRLCALDPRANFAPVHAWTDHRDYIYSLKTFGPLVLSGAGNGWLLVHDTTTGECLYGLGANTAAVREMCPTDRYLVAAGDDGKAVVYDFA